TEVDVLRLHQGRLAVHPRERVVHRRHGLDRLDHGVADEVREGDLPAPGALEVVVDDDAVVEQQLHRQRAHGRGRGQLQRGVHVLGHGGGRAAQGDLLGALLLRLGVLAVLGLAGGGRRLGRGGRGLRGGSGGLRRGGGLGRGLGGGRLGRGGGGLRGGGLRGGAGRGGRPGRVRARGRRGRGAHRGRGRGRARLVVREE